MVYALNHSIVHLKKFQILFKIENLIQIDGVFKKLTVALLKKQPVLQLNHMSYRAHISTKLKVLRSSFSMVDCPVCLNLIFWELYFKNVIFWDF